MRRAGRSRMPSSIRLPPCWRRYGVGPWVAVALTVVVVGVRSVDRGALVTDDHSRYHDRDFRVTRVVDGDTLDIDAADGAKPVTRIRLWGVDTPEIAHGRGHGSDIHFGREAAAFAERTLSGRSVHIVLSPKRSRGKYGRLLAYVFLDRGGPMFNEMLLEGGFAYADLRFPHQYAHRFVAIEKRARLDGVGLWKDVTLERMPTWKQRFERKAR